MKVIEGKSVKGDLALAIAQHFPNKEQRDVEEMAGLSCNYYEEILRSSLNEIDEEKMDDAQLLEEIIQKSGSDDALMSANELANYENRRIYSVKGISLLEIPDTIPLATMPIVTGQSSF